MKHVLLQVEEFLYQENLTVEWASINTATAAAGTAGMHMCTDI